MSHPASCLNPAVRNAALRSPRESSDLRREGSWLGQCNRVRAARPARPPDQRGDDWRHASGHDGCATTTSHRNFTRQPANRQTRQLGTQTGSSTKSLAAAPSATRIASQLKPACSKQSIVTSYTADSVSCNLRARITLSDSLSLKKNTQSHETRAALLHQHSQGRLHAAAGRRAA